MAIVLRTVELSNIRAHRFVRFTPAEVGITTLSGQNGAGKSTVIDSVAWALYGTKPTGVKKNSEMMRDSMNVADDKAFVVVELVVDNAELRVQRRFVARGASVECDVWERRIGEEEWNHVAGPAVSMAEPYIKRRLNIDEQGFLAAVLVQQKQVDQLISAGPKERAAVIERLTGITSSTMARDEARKELNFSKRALANMKVDEKLAQKLTKEKEGVDKSLVSTHAKAKKLADKLRALKVEFNEKTEALEHEEKVAQQAEKLTQGLVQIRARLEALEEELKRTTEMKDAKRKGLSALSGGIKLEEVERAHMALQGKLRDMDRAKERVDVARRSSQDRLAVIEKAIEESPHKGAAAVAEALAKAQRSAETAKSAITATKDKESSAKANIAKLDHAKSVISDEGGTCPTCLQTVSDPEHAIASLEEEREKSFALIEKLAVDQQEHSKALMAAEAEVSQLTSLSSIYKERAELTEKMEQLDKSEIELGSQVRVLESEIQVSENLYAQAKRHGETKAEYDAFRKRAVELSDEIQKLRGGEKTASDQLKELGKNPGGHLSQLRKKVADLTKDRDEMFPVFATLREEVARLDQQSKHLTLEIQRAEQDVQRYRSAVTQNEILAHSLGILEEFRESRIRTAVPMVGTYASDLITRFTDGKFTRLSLDEKFNATVTLMGGSKRSVGMLSGGELSAAALALRLAISMMLNSGADKAPILLDEVLVSQDASRALRILETIKEVCHGQVVIISHGPNSNDIADKVVEL